MANLYMCGFETGSIREISGQRAWGVDEGSIRTDVVRSGRYSCYVGGAGSEGVPEWALSFVVPAAGPEGLDDFYVQFSFYGPSTNLLFGGTIMRWYGYFGERELGRVFLGESGQLIVYVGKISYPGNEIFALASKTRCVVDTWYTVELHIKTDSSAGLIELRIDGVDEASFSGNTGLANDINPYSFYAYPDTIAFIGGTGGGVGALYFDDFIIDDSEWIDCQKIVLLRPEANGDVIEWDRTSDYDNYDHVNETPVDVTDYVYTSTVNAVDLYHTEPLPEEAAEIATLKSFAWAARNSVLEDAALAFVVKNGATAFTTIYESAPQNLYLNWRPTFYQWSATNPDTGLAWTVDDVNNLQSGVKAK